MPASQAPVSSIFAGDMQAPPLHPAAAAFICWCHKRRIGGIPSRQGSGMTEQTRIRIGLLGASGYTGADLIRLAATHPNIEIATLVASSHAGKPLAEVFPHFAFLDAPDLIRPEEADWDGCDAVFSGLPHG